MSPKQFRRALTEDRDTIVQSLAFAMLGIFLGCCVGHVVEGPAAQYSGRPWSRIVLIDGNFSAAESGHVMLGCESWVEAAGPRNVELTFARVEHARGVIIVPPEGTIQFMRYGTSDDIAELCSATKQTKRPLACWRADLRTVIVAGETIRPEQFQMIAAHELGHVMGLGHCPDKDRPSCSLPSVLGEHTNEMVETPSAVDVHDFCHRNGCTK